MPAFYPENNTVLPKDNELRTLHKIADLTGSGGGGGSQQVYESVGDPNTAGVLPTDQTKPALCNEYDGATHTTFVQQWSWDTVNLVWR